MKESFIRTAREALFRVVKIILKNYCSVRISNIYIRLCIHCKEAERIGIAIPPLFFFLILSTT